MKALSINKCRCRCKGDNLLHIISLFVGLYQINCFNLGIELYKPNQSFIIMWGNRSYTACVYLHAVFSTSRFQFGSLEPRNTPHSVFAGIKSVHSNL